MTGHAVIEAAKLHRSGFLNKTAVAAIAADPETRLTMLIVRCGGGRFVAPAQDVDHFVSIIEKEGSDYVRDVSLPADHFRSDAVT